MADELRETLDGVQIFRDVETIAPGEDFVLALERALAECAVMLVVIGPQWLDMRDAKEIATALARNVRVVPVLTGDAAFGDQQLQHADCS